MVPATVLRTVHQTRRGAQYGRGEHTIAGDLVEGLLMDPNEVTDFVRSTFQQSDYRPPMLPASALEVHRLSAQRDVQVSDVVAVLEKDQMLASGVLRAAQSSLYSRRYPPASLQDAVSRLGLTTIRDMAFAASLESKVFRAPGYADLMERIRLHSVASAHVARLIARGSEVSEYAFLCGLLHDVGMAAVTLVLADKKIRVEPQALATTLANLHEEAGRIAARSWKMPPGLEDAIASHHRPKDREAALATVAHFVASHHGFGVDLAGTPVEDIATAVEPACERLRLTGECLEKVVEEAEGVLKEVS